MTDIVSNPNVKKVLLKNKDMQNGLTESVKEILDMLDEKEAMMPFMGMKSISRGSVIRSKLAQSVTDYYMEKLKPLIDNIDTDLYIDLEETLKDRIKNVVDWSIKQHDK